MDLLPNAADTTTTLTNIVKVSAFEDNRFERDGFKFILSHFTHQKAADIWPRTISTFLTQNRQILIPYHKGERFALAMFKQSNLVDCRINAYPDYTEYNGIVRYCHDFIFIDLDLERITPFGKWSSMQLLDIVLDTTLMRMKKVLGRSDINPTIIWSGNGYHIYLPVEPFEIPLESDTKFCQFNEPSKRFLKFVAQFLTDGHSDPKNTPTFRSCLLRVPYSYNAKCLKVGKTKDDSLVYIKQQWNGNRPSIKPLIVQYYVHLQSCESDKKLLQQQQKGVKRPNNYFNHYNNNNNNNNKTGWIEKLLLHEIPDHRKYAIRKIIAPYLITRRGYDYNQSLEIINNWLYNINNNGLTDNSSIYDPKIKSALNNTMSKNWKPLSYDNLRVCNAELWQWIDELS